MNRLHINKFGLACGIVSAIFYVGCALFMMIMGEESTINFFNTLMHGIDVSSVIRMDVPLWESILGIVEIFILAWIGGALIAWFYNRMLPEVIETV